MFCPPPRHDTRYRCPVEYVEWLRQTLTKAHEYARVHSKVAARRQKRNYDTHCRPVTYEAGQFVWRWVPLGGSKKLARGWKGPYRVMGRATDINYYIQLTPEVVQVRVHGDSLKPHLGRVPPNWRGYEEADSGSEDSSTASSVSTSPENSLGKGAEESPNAPTPREAAELEGETSDSSTQEAATSPTVRRGTRARKPPPKMDL